VSTSGASDPVPRSLVWATDIDVLPLGRIVERRDRYLIVRSPSNPTHYWGNFLLSEDPPAAGDRERWERLFDAEFGAPGEGMRHRAFGWDQAGGGLGNAREEFVAHGYELEQNIGLVATPEQVRVHPRANRQVRVRALDHRDGAEEPLWDQVVELQVAGRDPGRFSETSHRRFCRARLADLRELFLAGHGAWYVALDAGDQVLASCGIVVKDGRGRYQSVDTALAHRRRGLCSRLVVDAGHDAGARHGVNQLVIAADIDYHALGIYESLGFQRAEHVCGVSHAEPGWG
jgi:hypothetical protein